MPNYTREGKIEAPITDEEFDAVMAKAAFVKQSFKRKIKTASGPKEISIERYVRVKGPFYKQIHAAFCVLLFYTAVRCSEALRVTTSQFKRAENKKTILFDVGPRMKKIKHKKICPQCKTQNALKALACKQCKTSLENVQPSAVGKPLKTQALPIPIDAPYAIELARAIAQTKPAQKLFPFSRKTAYNIVRRAFKYPHLFRLSRITWFFAHGWTIDQVKSWTGLTLAALEYYVGTADISRMGKSMAKRRKQKGE
jgi:hypothetical protein